MESLGATDSIDIEEIHSEILRETRKSMGLTQAALADLLGVTSNTVARWEAGRVPGRKHREQILALSVQHQLAGAIHEMRALATARVKPELPKFREAQAELQDLILVTLPRLYQAHPTAKDEVLSILATLTRISNQMETMAETTESASRWLMNQIGSQGHRQHKDSEENLKSKETLQLGPASDPGSTDGTA
jgi:transcriptional regulator with XRE-family HTH domain